MSQEQNYQRWFEEGRLNVLNQIAPSLVEITKLAFNGGAESVAKDYPLFQIKEPVQIKGGLSADDRGELSYNNDLDLRGIRRYYTLSNNDQRYVRCWHGHPRHEYKVFIPLIGSFIIVGWPFEMVNGQAKATGEPRRFAVSAKTPSAVIFPPGWMNGTSNLNVDNLLLVGSNLSVEESKEDDVRIPFDSTLYYAYTKLFEVPRR